MRIESSAKKFWKSRLLFMIASLICRVRCHRTMAAFLHRPHSMHRPPPMSFRRCLLSSLQAARKQERRQDFYSIEDLQTDRPLPPVLDSQTEDQGYGAYDYQPDIYDLQEMEKEGLAFDGLAAEGGRPSGETGRSETQQTPEATNDVQGSKPGAQQQGELPSEAQRVQEANDQPGMEQQAQLEEDDLPAEFFIVEETTENESTTTTTTLRPESSSLQPTEETDHVKTKPKMTPKATSSFANSSSSGKITTKATSSFANSSSSGKSKPKITPEAAASFADTSSSSSVRDRATPDTHFHAARVAGGPLDGFLEKASSGKGVATELDRLKEQQERVTQDIYSVNGKEFNINSPKQVSKALFGFSDESTRKEKLEGMAAGGNRLADLILQHRALKAQIKRLSRKQQDRDKGTHVRSALSVVRPDATVETSADPLMLVDASAYIFRAYYAMPPFHRSDGMPTGAVLGFCNMLNRLVLNRILAGEQPHLVLVFDAKGPTFRHELYDQYKGNRPAAPMDLIPQFALIREAAQAYGIAQIEAPRYEADDVIATLATMGASEGVDVNILSGDKDLMQLVSDPDVQPSIHMVDPMTMSRVTYDQVLEKWGVAPNRLGDVLALAGDASDNVPGVPGIGPKIAASLIEQFGSLEELLEQVDSVKQKGRREKLQSNRDQAILSRELVDLKRHVPVEQMTMPDGATKVQELRMEPVDTERLLAFYETMGFWDLKRRLEGRLGIKSGPKKAKTKKYPKAKLPKPDDFSDVPF